MTTALNGQARSFNEGAGGAVGMGGVIFLATGMVAGIVYVTTKSSAKALWTWTGLIVITLIFAGIGAARMVRG